MAANELSRLLVRLVTWFKEVASLCAVSTYGQELFSAITIVLIPCANRIVLFVRLSDTPLLLTTPFPPILVRELLKFVEEDLLRFVQERRVILAHSACCAQGAENECGYAYSNHGQYSRPTKGLTNRLSLHRGLAGKAATKCSTVHTNRKRIPAITMLVQGCELCLVHGVDYCLGSRPLTGCFWRAASRSPRSSQRYWSSSRGFD